MCDRWANEIWPNMHTGYVTLDWVEKQQSCVQANFSVLCGTSLFCRLLWLRTYILVKIYYFERQKWYVLNGLLKRTCGETKDWKWKAMAEKIESVRFASAWKYAWIFYRFFGSVLNGEFVLSLKKKNNIQGIDAQVCESISTKKGSEAFFSRQLFSLKRKPTRNEMNIYRCWPQESKIIWKLMSIML